jgi:hypothetical protein
VERLGVALLHVDGRHYQNLCNIGCPAMDRRVAAANAPRQNGRPRTSAALQTLRQVVRLRPGYGAPYEYIAASLAYLGQSDEAREALERIPPQSLEQLQRWEQRPPWMRPEDYALRVEGVRLAAGERRRRDPNQL